MSRKFQADSLSLLQQPPLRPLPISPFDLLGQKEPFPIAVTLHGTVEPKLSIAWKSFHQGFFSQLGSFFTWTSVPKGEIADNVFRDWRVPRSIPARAIVAAALWHVVFFIVPWPTLPNMGKRNPAFENAELTWSGPIDDLPLLNVPKKAPKTTRAKVQPAEPAGTDAYHPRQRIFTDPAHPTHPRQTLVRPNAPMDAPKFLPALPNMVQLASTAGPARPRLEISEQALAKLRPKQVKRRVTPDTPTDAPNLETHPTDMNIAALPMTVERPKLQVNAGSVPRVAAQMQNGEVAAPELAFGSNGASETIIALSSTPAPPAAVVEVPKGNLASRVAMSPEGKGAGSGGGSSNGIEASGEGGGDTIAKSAVGISISGGNPKPNSTVSNVGGVGKLTLPRSSGGYKRPDPNTSTDDPPERTGPPNFALLPPGAKPEQIFSNHRVYSMNVNMPNLNSVTGSWIIRFAELHMAGTARISGDLNAPVPLRKIDPKYPQTAIQEHIQGEVILYGVIRPDGSVDSIQLVRGIDEQLDANAVAAFAQWKFEPATKSGQPVALEAIVHIPFRGPERE
jgi:TonB family protein